VRAEAGAVRAARAAADGARGLGVAGLLARRGRGGAAGAGHDHHGRRLPVFPGAGRAASRGGLAGGLPGGGAVRGRGRPRPDAAGQGGKCRAVRLYIIEIRHGAHQSTQSSQGLFRVGQRGGRVGGVGRHVPAPVRGQVPAAGRGGR
ncbi:unnamed protein product, partial [Heterosigma akashiwo]